MDSLLQSVGAGTDAEEEQFSEALAYVPSPLPPLPPPQPPVARKPKKKSSSNSNNVWTKPTSRKKPKKNKSSSNATTPTPNNINNHPTGTSSASATNNKNPSPDHRSSSVLITPVPRFPDKSDDSPLSPILLSRFHKAERVDLSDDRLTAGSTKGYRMVRATRGVLSGSWYFEIRVLHLGPTGHVRLGWVMDKGDLQAPVGYDRYGYGYRDMDGSKVHRALREPYGEGGYGEGDVVGFYVNLPEGDKYAPKMPQLVWYKGQRYMYSSYATTPGADGKDESPNVVPGSEISFFKNGACQGVAFKELVGGRYYPAASMYTLPNQPNCEVRFNFGPNFEAFPQDFGGRLIPRPMSEVPYHGNDVKAEEAPMENGFHEKII